MANTETTNCFNQPGPAPEMNPGGAWLSCLFLLLQNLHRLALGAATNPQQQQARTRSRQPEPLTLQQPRPVDPPTLHQPTPTVDQAQAQRLAFRPPTSTVTASLTGLPSTDTLKAASPSATPTRARPQATFRFHP